MMYNRTSLDRYAYWLFKDKIPFTKLLIVGSVFVFFFTALGVRILQDFLAFNVITVLAKPWTVVTYPLAAENSVIGLLFQCYWLWIVGGRLERGWSTRTFGIFFVTISVVTALSLLVGSIITGFTLVISGLWLPLAALTIAFAMMNPEQQILFFFIIPLKLKYLALITVGLVFLGYGQVKPLLGIFALSGCAYSYWYIRSASGLNFNFTRRANRTQVIRVHRRPGGLSWLNPLARLKEHRERKKLKDFLDRSGFDDR